MNSFRKAWEVFLPWVIYYLTYNAAYIILTFFLGAMQNRLGEGAVQWVTAHAATVGGVIGGFCMLLGVWPLLPSLKRELTNRVEEDGKTERCGNGKRSRRSALKAVIVTVILAVSSSLALNILLSLTGMVDNSHTYQEVAGRQYGVVFGIGLILYGLVSPLAEEVLFRGLIYNRLRRFYGPVVAVIASGILFGVFHGNLVQGVYGTCMGILIAYVYERRGSFFFPFLFHVSANLAVYSAARAEAVQDVLFTPAGGLLLLAAAMGSLLISSKNFSDAREKI